MPTYKAPVDDALFLLNDVFHLDRYGNLPGFADASPDVVEAVLREAAKFSEEVLTPLNRVGDTRRLHAPPRRQRHHADRLQGRLQAAGRRRLDRHLGAGRVRRPGPAGDADRGGQRIPLLGQHGLRHVSGAHAGRHRRAARACLARAEGQVPAEDGGRRLDRHHEPDRAALRHRSRPAAHARRCKQSDGSYKITGTKIFISAGEHDLSENIVHLVLARIEGAPAGTKGISLFVVPKIMVKDDGSLGRAQWRHLRLDRREDGHPRQRHLRDELRRRHRLAGRRGESRAAPPCSR